jgi:hypothetical protein
MLLFALLSYNNNSGDNILSLSSSSLMSPLIASFGVLTLTACIIGRNERILRLTLYNQSMAAITREQHKLEVIKRQRNARRR